MDKEADLFGQPLAQANGTVKPLEPLYSMLAVMPLESLRFTLESLQEFDNESALEDRFDNVGLTRREYIQQVMIVMSHRGVR